MIAASKFKVIAEAGRGFVTRWIIEETESFEHAKAVCKETLLPGVIRSIVVDADTNQQLYSSEDP